MAREFNATVHLCGRRNRLLPGCHTGDMSAMEATPQQAQEPQTQEPGNTVLIRDTPLSSEEAANAVSCDGAGATTIFIGTTRDNFDGGRAAPLADR